MEIPELEAEVVRLKGEVAAREATANAIAGRIVEVNRHHEDLAHRFDDLHGELQAMKKSLRWLLAKARGEEEAL